MLLPQLPVLWRCGLGWQGINRNYCSHMFASLVVDLKWKCHKLTSAQGLWSQSSVGMDWPTTKLNYPFQGDASTNIARLLIPLVRELILLTASLAVLWPSVIWPGRRARSRRGCSLPAACRRAVPCRPGAAAPSGASSSPSEASSAVRGSRGRAWKRLQHSDLI